MSESQSPDEKDGLSEEGDTESMINMDHLLSFSMSNYAVQDSLNIKKLIAQMQFLVAQANFQ